MVEFYFNVLYIHSSKSYVISSKCYFIFMFSTYTVLKVM